MDPSKMRKKLYNASHHVRHKLLNAHVSDQIRERYGIRSFPVRKGDVVRVMRGTYKGMEGKVSKVDMKKIRIAIEGILRGKTDKKQIPVWIHPSKVEITKLDLSDKKRREKLEKIANMKNIKIEEGESVEQASEEVKSAESDTNTQKGT
ncbi:MAG: 50S ribosomal protein L24 [Thermoplasmata archaeon]|jgi:large subunit ribosomal protein L24